MATVEKGVYGKFVLLGVEVATAPQVSSVLHVRHRGCVLVPGLMVIYNPKAEKLTLEHIIMIKNYLK